MHIVFTFLIEIRDFPTSHVSLPKGDVWILHHPCHLEVTAGPAWVTCSKRNGLTAWLTVRVQWVTKQVGESLKNPGSFLGSKFCIWINSLFGTYTPKAYPKGLSFSRGWFSGSITCPSFGQWCVNLVTLAAWLLNDLNMPLLNVLPYWPIFSKSS